MGTVICASVVVVLMHRPTAISPKKAYRETITPPSPIAGAQVSSASAAISQAGPQAITASFSPALANFLDSTAKNRVTSDISERIPMVTDPDQVAAVVEMLRDATEDDTVRNEAMNLLRRSGYARLSECLLEVLDQPGEQARFRSFLVQHLGHELETVIESKRASITSRLRNALDDTQIPVRREALMALCEVGDPMAMRMVDGGLIDPHCGDMRDLIIRLQLERDRRESIPAIRALANDPDEATRIAAIHALGSWRDEASRAVLEAAAKMNHERTSRAAILALRTLDGKAANASVR